MKNLKMNYSHQMNYNLLFLNILGKLYEKMVVHCFYNGISKPNPFSPHLSLVSILVDPR